MGRDFTRIGGNFRLCAVDQKKPFFLRVRPFLDLLPFKGPFPLTGALTGRPPYGKAPYGEASYGKAPSGRFLTGDTFNYITRRDGPYGKGRSLTGRAGVPYGSLQKRTTKRLTGRQGQYGSPLRRGTVPMRRAGPLREGPGFLYGSFTEKDDEEAYGKGPYGKLLTRRNGPYGKGRSLQKGRLLTGRPLTSYRKTYGKQRGGTLQELGGNYGLCAVDQKKSFFPKVGPFLDLLPFKGPFPLTGTPLTGNTVLTGASYGRFLQALTGRALTGRLLMGGKPKIQNPNPKSKIQSRKPKIQNPKPESNNPKSKTQKVFFPFAL